MTSRARKTTNTLEGLTKKTEGATRKPGITTLKARSMTLITIDCDDKVDYHDV
jgi:hypothetical protein